MKRRFLSIVCVLFGMAGESVVGESVAGEVGGVGDGGEEDLLVVFWNLENFFDWVDGSRLEDMDSGKYDKTDGCDEMEESGGEETADREFSAAGGRRWSRKRFYGKCDAVAKALFWMGDRYGRMPDLIGVAEVENKGVLQKLLRATALRKYDYGIVHYESGDRRGIDVAVMYRKSSMELVSSSLGTPSHNGEKMTTRDILHVKMRLPDGQEVDFVVNHHPSKFGGEKESKGRREAAMETLKQICDSLGNEHVIAMGDFNDTPDSESFDMIGNTLVNKGTVLHERGEGTIRYDGKWDLIDMFMVSAPLDSVTRMEVCRIPFLMVRDRRHPGEKPLRTYSGPRYLGGVSDHCPIVLKMKQNRQKKTM